jgi:hypothetical protein
MMIAASQIGISLPFAGTLAWTPFVLVGAGSGAPVPTDAAQSVAAANVGLSW